MLRLTMTFFPLTRSLAVAQTNPSCSALVTDQLQYKLSGDGKFRQRHPTNRKKKRDRNFRHRQRMY